MLADKPNLLPEPAALLFMYERMLLIRRAEEQLGRDVRLGRTPGQVHLSDGQEAVAVGVCAHLGDRDQITSTHRGHGHFLAKGGDVRAAFAEIYGKAEGICGGMGGSMHVADFSRGIVGANGIVGAGFGIAVGATFAHKLDGHGRIAACFFGDGASNQGTLMESLNIGVLWKLPLLFVCENNGFSEFSPSDTVTAGVISDRARPFGVPVWNVDGNDVVAVWRATGEALDHIRSGNGPAFLEAKTYRYSGHFSAEERILAAPYRSDSEIAEWRERDPIGICRALMETQGIADADVFGEIHARVEAAIETSVAYAADGHPPDAGTAQSLMFARSAD